jgi:diaminohydroxyphosphoribosylaminopyrimidine deaminase/5-amino-6-(5-phosphoribosylamino)uracil reductase
VGQKYKNNMMNDKSRNEFFMQRCIMLAQKGKGSVAPNPMVGAVIVCNNVIIGEGYHVKYGQAHAEVNAINSVSDKTLLSKSTIYVSLEPCSHFGKTPPCADLIIHHNIPNVVIGMVDPFAKVNGMGIKKLRDAGCNVEVGVLETECWNLNKEFIVFHTQQRPYIILKWAQTLDGLIDKIREPGDIQHPNWITNEVCRSLVHKWRAEMQAIMVGTNTALVDNPKLNVRSWAGNSPLRIVLDRDLSLPKTLNLYDKTQPTLVVNEIKNECDLNTEYLKIDFGESLLRNLLKELYKRGIASLFVEGGQELFTTFIGQNYWDEARIFTGNRYFNSGISAPSIKGKIVSQEQLRDNVLTIMDKG